MDITAQLAELLPEIWLGLLGVFLALYVILDGFDLGVGILSLFAGGDEARRDILMSSLGNVWDANETWLVVLGGALFGAFPLAYGTLLNALYIPILLMLTALIFRAVAFEFREHSHHKLGWNIAFGLGSLLAALTQGFALGALISGIDVGADGHFAGGPWDWFSGFSLVVALGVVQGYVLLGATYLVLKTSGNVQKASFRHAWWAGWTTMAAAAVVTTVTPLTHTYVGERWFSDPGILWFAPWPVLALFAFWRLMRGIARRQEKGPFLWTLMVFISSLMGLAMSLFPYIIPMHITIYMGAASSTALIVMLLGIGFFFPIMLVYNGYQYFVFRGKITRPG